MKVFLTNFLAVKTKGDILEKADNPWAYLHKVIEGHEIESGVPLYYNDTNIYALCY